MIQDPVLIQGNAENLHFAFFSVIGNRSEQQDAFGYVLNDAGGLFMICDGMGGLKGGSLAAHLGIETVGIAFEQLPPFKPPTQALLSALREADRKIAALKDAEGHLLSAGSTLVSVLIQQKNLDWFSVGDSRACLLRGEEFVPFTKDQNYRTVLEEQRRAGLITQETYLAEIPRGEALISYLGIGNLSLIDYSRESFPLQTGDRLLLMSDGLYRLMPDEEITEILRCVRDPSETLRTLEHGAACRAKKAGILRDNMTAAILDIE